jgi:phytoene dehydrogenase-like protein
MSKAKPAGEVIVVGSGHNGLAAAIEMARGGFPVTVLEAANSIGGGSRSGEITLPGFRHDICSAIHPLAASSPFFKVLPLQSHGLHWIEPPAALAHPFDDGSAALLSRSIAETVASLDAADAAPYAHLFSPLVDRWEEISSGVLGPILSMPRHPLLMARFGLHALRSAQGVASGSFAGERARALFGGLAAHSFLPLDKSGSAAFALVLGILGHVTGWPFPAGGSSSIPESLAGYLETLGGKIVTGRRVASIDELPAQALIFFEVTPRQLLEIAGERFGSRYRRRLSQYRYGPGVFKIDWALSAAIPWRARECSLAGTVHLGGTLAEIAASEREVWEGGHPERPFVLVVQQSLFDAARAPEGKHTGWAYCHVPNGSGVDMTERIESQLERFAPGFRDLILARHVINTGGYQLYNENYVGGDINGGVQDLAQMIARPVAGFKPYQTDDDRIYLCSAATPPGGGVHGMCGYLAARCAIDRHG